MLPLVAALGLMGLGGAQDAVAGWFGRRNSADAADRVRGMLGDAPGLMYPGDANTQGPPEQTPGSGLMADPTDPRKQLDFAQGIMALPPEQRRAAALIFEPILARAQQQAAERARQAQQGGQFATEQAGIAERFDRQRADVHAEFDFNRQKYGEQFALEKRARDDAHLKELQDIELNKYRLRDAALKDPGADALGPVPSGSARVNTAEGPVIVPLRGTEPWLKEDTARKGIVGAYQNLDALDKLVEQHGTETWDGKTVAAMKFRYGHLLSSLAALESSGHTRYSKEQIETLRDQIGDPTGITNTFKSTAKLRAGYAEARQYLQDEFSHQSRRTQGWQGFGGTLTGAAAGREIRDAGARQAPPAPRGTVPYTGAAAGPMW